tara:strand:- start:1323 stop:1715 length:393 start_codon:yes stop_codon:yes gene_type:complete
MRTVIKQTELPFMASTKARSSSPLDRLKRASNLTAERKIVRLTDGQDFEFWCTPMTMAEREQAQKGTKDDANAFAIRLFVSKALQEDGRRMFQAGQIDELKHDVSAENMDRLMLALLPSQDDEDDLDPKE